MLLNEYQAKINQLINKYVAQGYIQSVEFSVDYRSKHIGYIKGYLEFYDGSYLHFKEYVELQSFINKLAYSFHYQDKNRNLIFRYDNAKHKPDLGYVDHKHIGDQISPSAVPEFEIVIMEIIDQFLSP